MTKRIPLGTDNFIDANNLYYVDKTNILIDILDNCIGRPLLITRPRRFGKSLAVSMLEYFFTCKGDYEFAFKDKNILKDDKYKKYLNSYPVIHINMKNVSNITYNEMMQTTYDLISDIYRKFPEVLSIDGLFDFEKNRYLDYANRVVWDKPSFYIESIKFLTQLLYKKYNKKVVILIDEYDTPLEIAHQNGFYNEAVEFFKRFYSATLKSNENVLFSFTTGVLQIGKESIFSELNNLNTFDVCNENFQEYFGFTKEEVIKIIKDFNVDVDIDKLEQYYGGYGTNKTRIFNPWSVLSYIDREEYEPYWTNTGSNQTISDLICEDKNNLSLLNEFINNNNLVFKFNNSLSYKDVKNNKETLFSYLIQAGYLTAKKSEKNGYYYLRIPNLELLEVFEKEIIQRNSNENIFAIAIDIRNALLFAKVDVLTNLLNKYILESFSYYDLRDEKDYQIMITTLFAVLFQDYLVKSEVNNRFGRCDIMLMPKNNKEIGMVIELKFFKGRIGTSRLNKKAEDAIKQIHEQTYFSQLKNMGIKKVLLYGFVFDDNSNVVKFEMV